MGTLLLLMLAQNDADILTARFALDKAEAAASCPDRAAITDAVAARLGRVPFDDKAELLITAHLDRSDRFTARVVLHRGEEIVGERALASSSPTCDELAEAVALAIAIALDPFVLQKPRVQPPPPPPKDDVVVEVTKEPEPPPAPEVTEPESPPSSTPLAFEAWAGGFMAIGTAPAPTLGVRAGAALLADVLRLGLEGRADLPAGAPVSGGDVETHLLTAALMPCVRMTMVLGCGVLEAGAMRAQALGLPGTTPQTSPWLAGGGRIALEVPFLEVWRARVHLDVLAPITRVSVRARGQDEPLWTTPPIQGSLGVQFGWAGL